MLCSKCGKNESVRKRVNSWCKECLYAVRQNSYRKGIVYVLQCPHGEIKVGGTTNLKKRLETIGTCNPEKLRVIRKIQSQTTFETEKKIHILLDKFRIKGEWYKAEALEMFDKIEHELTLE